MSIIVKDTLSGASNVLSTVLTGLSTATNAVITAADTLLVAMGKLQAQITGIDSSSTETTNTATVIAITGTHHTHTITALASANTIGAPTGTLTDKNQLIIRIKDNGTARALTYNAVFRVSSDLALPSTTVVSKTLYLGFKYNVADTKWDLLAVLGNF
jgi:hypothetical protein